MYVCVYIYICCEVIIWSKFGDFKSYYLVQVSVIIWSKMFWAYVYSGFELFLQTQISFCVFWVPNYDPIFQKSFQKMVPNGFIVFRILCCMFNIWKTSSFRLPKHKNRGFNILCCLKKRKGKRNDNWNVWFGVVLVQEWPFRDRFVTQISFPKKQVCWNPYFVVFWGARFLGQVVKKREMLDPFPKKENSGW